MGAQDGDWRDGLKGGAAKAGPFLRGLGRFAVDVILPPMTFDRSQDAAGAGMGADEWSRIVFLDGPVCDGCGAAFEHDGGAFSDSRCAACMTQPYGFARARAACVYDEASRGLILKFKHGDQQQYAPLFARWLSRAADDLIHDAGAVVPVPLHPMRLLSRRFNQAAEVARPLAKAARLDYLPDALARTQRTASQGGKSARGRRENVKAAFGVTEAGRRRIKGRRVLLIDDVLTTGATAEACARVLIAAGATAVDLAVIARVKNARQLAI